MMKKLFTVRLLELTFNLPTFKLHWQQKAQEAFALSIKLLPTPAGQEDVINICSQN